MKTIEDHFRDWENYAFGYGYGSGEPYVLSALRKFMDVCDRIPPGGAYEYLKLEEELTPTVAWLLINVLCGADILEYGTSPRCAWLTGKGQRLKAFMLSLTVEDLVGIVARDSDEYVACYPDACNCGPKGYEPGRKCQNPFFAGTL